MNSVRPLIILKTNSDVAKLTAAVRAAVACRSSQGLILIEAPATARSGINRFLDSWNGQDGDAKTIGKRGHHLADELARFGLRFRVEVCRELTPAIIMRHARRFHSDLIITERRQNVAGRFLTYLDEDTGLLAACQIPVWLCGRRTEPDSPIVAAIDPAPKTQAATENNSRVIRTAFALASKCAPKKKIHFLAICEVDSKLISDSAQQTRVRAMNDLRAEIFRDWPKHSQSKTLNGEGHPLATSPCVPVQISMHHGTPEVVSMTLDEIQPAVIVTGKPLRSALSRFMRPGMLSTFSASDHSVLTVTEQRLKPAATSPTDTATTSGRHGNVSSSETVC